MAEREKMPPEKNNITKFRQDRRGQICGLFKSLALLGLLCSMVYCVWNYHEQLTLSSLRRMASYFSAVWASRDADFAGYTFEDGIESVYDEFGNGLVVLGGDTLSFVSTQGKEELSIPLQYSSPALSVVEDNMLAYDRGGHGLCLTNRYTALWQKELESEIISASVNQNGAFSVVTDEQGYRAAVTLYDNQQKERFRWNTSEYYILLSCVSPDSQHLAALCMSEENGKRVSMIRVFSIHQEQPLFDLPLGSMTVYSMEYYEDDSLMIITDQGVYSYDEQGQERGSFAYAEGSLVTFSHKMGQRPVVALETGDQQERTQVVMVGENGQAVFESRYSSAVRTLSAAGDHIAILLRDSLVCTSIIPGASARQVQEITARDVIQRRDGDVMLIYADRAELLDKDAVERIDRE